MNDCWGDKVYRFESVDSTQIWAEKLAQAGAPHGTVIIADEQLEGRGRLGRSWQSAAGKGVWLSIIIRPQLRIEYLSQITLLSSLAITQTLSQLYNLDVKVKWPNDIYYERYKLGGVLTQAKIVGEKAEYIILGIGLNTDKTTFSKDLRTKAISIEEVVGYSPDKRVLITGLLNKLAKLYQEYEITGFKPFLIQYLENLYGKGEHVIVDNQLLGRINGVNQRGELILLNDAGSEHIITSGEIKFVR